MIRLRRMVHYIVLLGALCMLTVSASSQAEPVPLDEKGSSTKEEEPAKEQPKEKKAITVPAGTAMMVKTGTEVSSKDKPGRKFSATLEANLLAGDEVVAKAGTQVYGQVVKSGTAEPSQVPLEAAAEPSQVRFGPKEGKNDRPHGHRNFDTGSRQPHSTKKADRKRPA